MLRILVLGFPHVFLGFDSEQSLSARSPELPPLFGTEISPREPQKLQRSRNEWVRLFGLVFSEWMRDLVVRFCHLASHACLLCASCQFLLRSWGLTFRLDGSFAPFSVRVGLWNGVFCHGRGELFWDGWTSFFLMKVFHVRSPEKFFWPNRTSFFLFGLRNFEKGFTFHFTSKYPRMEWWLTYLTAEYFVKLKALKDFRIDKERKEKEHGNFFPVSFLGLVFFLLPLVENQNGMETQSPVKLTGNPTEHGNLDEK